MTSERVLSQLEGFWTGPAGRSLRAWLPGLVTLGCALGVAWTAAGLLWAWMPAPALPAPAAQAAATPAQNAKGGVDIPALVALHLFGQSSTPDQGPDAAAVDAPETHLNLSLRGVLAANDKRAVSLAIIASGNAAQNYKVGDSVPGGASVHAILGDRVILDRNGRLEALSLPKHDTGENFVPASDAKKPSPMDMFSSGGKNQPQFKPSGKVPSPDQLKTLAQQNPDKLFEIARPEPVMEKGRMLGFRLHAGRDHGALGAYGLQSGDVVTRINGKPLDNIARSMKMLQNLDSSKPITLTIKRNGRTQQVTLPATQ